MSWLQEWYLQIHRNLLAEDAIRLIVGGFRTTVVIFFFGAIWAILLASFITYLRLSRRCQWLCRPLQWFVSTIHDVPSVVLMMFFYYVVFSASSDGVLVTIIALGVYTSGSLSNIFRIHILQVGKEQHEAGRMLGFTPWQVYRYVVLPQAVRSMLPLVIGELKVLLRATSYAGYVAQRDLVKAVDCIRSETGDVFVPLLFISLLYLFLSWLIGKAIQWLNVKIFCHD